jgi:hypothetical protein
LVSKYNDYTFVLLDYVVIVVVKNYLCYNFPLDCAPPVVTVAPRNLLDLYLYCFLRPSTPFLSGEKFRRAPPEKNQKFKGVK